VAAVIAQQFDRTDLLADNRDAYVAAAPATRRGCGRCPARTSTTVLT
jgi:hypothetical protein